ncbi:MAG: prepilin peptidase, partial [Planctomycetaceae bacterium]|nr:prepilin peptidase [Planctomycetaceae bacterium]
GAGDVKLMAAVGAWLGIPLTFHIFIASSLTAGVYAIILLVFGGGLSETWVNLQIIWYRLATFGRHLGSDNRLELEATRSDRRKRCVPFAAMVAMGTILTFVWMFIHGTVKIYN